MLIVFGALKIELIPILRSIHIYNIHKCGKTILYEGFKNSRPITIIQTGMGADNARKAAKFFKDNYLEYIKSSISGPGDNTEVLMIGFCGSTDRSIKIGDTIAYRSIKNIGHSNGNYFVQNSILDLNRERLPGFLPSSGSTGATGGNVPEVITSPVIKKKLNSDLGIQAIDMESYWIGKVVLDMKLPFSCIGIVSDGAEDVLPSYFENPSGTGMAANIALSFIGSIFSKKEFRSNINALKNLKKANLRLAKVSAELISSFTAGTSDNTL